ncbi:MAG: diphthine--ammonia ligase [Bacillota bacterium]
MEKENNLNFFSSWSGGKDSCLALYYALENGGKAQKLLTMLVDDGERSRSHGLSLELLNKQAEALNIPIITANTSWDEYEENFIDLLEKLKKEKINAGVFGDIDLEEHREWVERVCKKVDMKAELPLWKMDRREVIEKFIELGFEAEIIVVKDNKLGERFLGKKLNFELIDELEEIGVDVCGENGEYHTVVLDGPIFSKKVAIERKEKVKSKGYIFQNIEVK